jgi:hypothetical protein
MTAPSGPTPDYKDLCGALLRYVVQIVENNHISYCSSTEYIAICTNGRYLIKAAKEAGL